MPQQPFFQEHLPPGVFNEFEQIYGQNSASSLQSDGTPQGMLSGYLRSFMDSGRAQIPFHPIPLPDLGLSDVDKQRIRDRSSIMARHIFADKGEEYANAQVYN